MQLLKPYSDTRSAKYPEPVYIVIVKSAEGRFNPMSAAWAMFTSIEPPMLAVSIGYQRHTYELIKAQGEFVISIPSEKMAAEVEFFGSNSGRDLDKLVTLGTEVQAATKIDNVLLSKASANYECRVTGTLNTGDHMIFAGEILASHLNQDKTSRIFTLGAKHFGGVKPHST